MRIDDHTVGLTAEEGARVVALGLVGEARAAAEAFAAGAGEEPLHDFRVAVRRLRSALRTFRPWLEGSVARRRERKLRKLARSTNDARDAEVHLAWLARQGERLAPRQRAGWELAKRRLEARAHGEVDAARVAARFERLAAKLEPRLSTLERRVAAAEDPGASFGGVLASLVGDQLDALAARLDAIGDAADEQGAHRARIEGKRLRYLLEPLRGFRGADASAAIRRLKKLQDVLGELHDAHVLAGELRDALVEAAAERARRVHESAYAPPGNGAARAGFRGSARPGLVALVRLVRERRDALHSELERAWRGRGMGALAREVKAVAAGLAARAGGKLEHERKFLLAALPPRAEEDEGVEIVQGYLPGDLLRERVRRVRGKGGARYWRAVKRGAGARRLEAEEETTRKVFEALWPLTAGRRVAKRRRRVREGSLVWEIDEFSDRELVLAEVELPAHAPGDVRLPDWLRRLVLRDVTDDPAYSNERLAATRGVPRAGAASGAPGEQGATAPDAGASPSP